MADRGEEPPAIPEQKTTKNSKESKSLPYFSRWEAILPQFHGCWQETQGFWVRDKRLYTQSTTNSMTISIFTSIPLAPKCPRVMWMDLNHPPTPLSLPKKPAHAVGYIMGEEP